MADIVEAWPDVVGEGIARNAWPGRVARDGTLHVATSSSAWAFELAHLAPELLRRLAETLGESAPKALKFAPGRLPEPAVRAESEVARTLPRPTPAELAAAREIAAGIGDEELRELVARAAAASLARPRSDR